MEKEVSIIIRVEGGDADDGLLDIHDAASTILGIARSVNIVAHAFANEQEIRTRADHALGSKTFIHSSKKGCFEEQIDIRFTKKVSNKIGHSVLNSHFWDFLSACWASAVGKEHPTNSPYLRKILEKNPEFFDEIAIALESPMQSLLKPIGSDESITISLCRPRVEKEILTFDKESLDYVTILEETDKTEYLLGNVTRYNVLSDFGRLFSDEENRVISFELREGKKNTRVKNLFIKSMKYKIEGEEGKLYFKVSKIKSSAGFVKRYVVYDALDRMDDEQP